MSAHSEEACAQQAWIARGQRPTRETSPKAYWDEREIMLMSIYLEFFFWAHKSCMFCLCTPTVLSLQKKAREWLRGFNDWLVNKAKSSARPLLCKIQSSTNCICQLKNRLWTKALSGLHFICRSCFNFYGPELSLTWCLCKT